MAEQMFGRRAPAGNLVGWAAGQSCQTPLLIVKLVFLILPYGLVVASVHLTSTISILSSARAFVVDASNTCPPLTDAPDQLGA